MGKKNKISKKELFKIIQYLDGEIFFYKTQLSLSKDKNKTIEPIKDVEIRFDLANSSDESIKQYPQFWYVRFYDKHPNIEEFEELFIKLSNIESYKWGFEKNILYGYSGSKRFNGFDCSGKSGFVEQFDRNQDKMVEVTIEQAIEIMKNWNK